MPPLSRALHARVPDVRRVDAYYLPLALLCASRVGAATRRPFVLGIQGPQGCGKSTLAGALVGALGDVGVRGVAVSIDDFYLTRGEQLALAARHPGNPYLLHRGYPGTHDVPLGERTLEALRGLGPGQELLVPVYDKSAHHGRGDRAPRAAWRAVSGPLDLIVLEGWMLGFSPVEDATLEPHLCPPDAMLAAYGAWNHRLDALVRLDVASPDTIVRWRVDAERARRDRGEPALGEDEARDYIERFLTAYRVWVPELRARPPCADVLHVELGEDRMPLVAVAAPTQGPG